MASATGRAPSRVRAFGPQFRDLVRHNFHDFDKGEQAWGLHNVYVEGGKLYTLAVGEMLVRDLSAGRTESVRLGGYLRGLARTEGRWYIGRSRLTERERRREGMGEVLALDDDFRLLGTARLGDAGQVYEVRAFFNVTCLTSSSSTAANVAGRAPQPLPTRWISSWPKLFSHCRARSTSYVFWPMYGRSSMIEWMA